MFLEKLSQARGVSGDEAGVRAMIADQIRKYVDEYRTDALGNLIAWKRGVPRRRARRTSFKLLLAAHMDEVGLVVTHIDADGYLHFERVGSIDERILPSKMVLIGETGVPGVIGLKPRHLTPVAELEKVVSSADLVIDIGAISREDAERVVKVGDYATFAAEFTPFGDNCVRGKALDDRVGCALLVELLRDEYPFDLYAAFTAQEEVGLRGARVAAYNVEPDAALVLEATVCDDSPARGRGATDDVSPTTRLGAGPALTLADRSLIADRRLVHWLEQTAREHNIPYQFKQPLVGGTDAGRLHLTRAGVPSAVVSVPARYIHGPAAVISLDDFHHTLRLLRAALATLPNHLAR